MSLKERKKKKVSFVLKPGRKPGHVKMVERDEEGMLGPASEAMEFRLKSLKEKPVDLLTHEFSERALKRATEDTSGRSMHADTVRRYTKKGKYDVPVLHAMISHDTESGLEVGGKTITLMPAQFEEWFWKTGIPEVKYPMMVQYRNQWNAAMNIGKRATTKNEIKTVLVKMKKIEKESRGKIPSSKSAKMQRQIQQVERMLI